MTRQHVSTSITIDIPSITIPTTSFPAHDRDVTNLLEDFEDNLREIFGNISVNYQVEVTPLPQAQQPLSGYTSMSSLLQANRPETPTGYTRLVTLIG